MSTKRLGKQTVRLDHPPCLAAGGSVVGPKEGEGPLKGCFDRICDDPYFGAESWEKAEMPLPRSWIPVSSSTVVLLTS